ncbi:Uncharacterised protein [Streptococcus pneumoniae]|nr:Uncharacterised protein [Streptococcus pneumoniae]
MDRVHRGGVRQLDEQADGRGECEPVRGEGVEEAQPLAGDLELAVQDLARPFGAARGGVVEEVPADLGDRQVFHEGGEVGVHGRTGVTLEQEERGDGGV